MVGRLVAGGQLPLTLKPRRTVQHEASGRNVIIGVRSGPPTITNGGITIAKDVFLENENECLGARVMRTASMQTTDKVGHGTITAMLLAQAILKKRFESMRDETDVMRD